jgi:hypothetical protein
MRYRTTQTPEIDDLRSQIVDLESDLLWQQNRYQETRRLVNDLALSSADAIIEINHLTNDLARQIIEISDRLPR